MAEGTEPVQANICTKLMMRHIGKTKAIAAENRKQATDNRSNSCTAVGAKGGVTDGEMGNGKRKPPSGLHNPQVREYFRGEVWLRVNKKTGEENPPSRLWSNYNKRVDNIINRDETLCLLYL